MSWLQGGPFLEISFAMVPETDRRSFADNILSKLRLFTPTIEFAIPSIDLQEKIDKFVEGYPDNEVEPNATVYHQVQIPVFVDLDGKRKSMLALEQISSKLIVVDFWFFGSVHDAPEWGQKGIKQDQIHLFKDMLHRLYETFHFAIGTVAYENGVTAFFDTSEGWPHESYRLENVNKAFVQLDHDFITIIVNKNYIQLEGRKDIEVIGDKMVLDV